MAYYLMVARRILAQGVGPGGADVMRPDFGTLTETFDRNGWTQQSMPDDSGRLLVRVKCEPTQAALVVAETGAAIVLKEAE